MRTSLPATRDRRFFSYPWPRTQLLPCWIGCENGVGSERALDRCTNSHATSLPWVLFVPSPLPGVRLVATWPTVRHLPPGVLSVRRRLASWPRSYFDVASENDVSDEIDVDGTSTDGATRSTSRVLTARDTARAHKQVGGSSGSTRVRWVELLDLRRLVHGEVLTCRSEEG